jgi:bifunctional non-homologous end joining protein LigD
MMKPLHIPRDQDNAVLTVDGKELRLTNLRKMFWTGRRARSSSRSARVPRPAWIETCAIDHGEEKVSDFPMIQDRAELLWVINLGCIDLNQWYATCDDVDRPDDVHFDLDPGVRATFDRVLETARVVRDALDALKMPSVVKTTGSKGLLHVYVPIVRGPLQLEVRTLAHVLAQELARRHPALITAEYRVAKRPRGRVLVDDNRTGGAARWRRSTRCGRGPRRPFPRR